MAKKILLAEDSITMQKVVEMTFAAEDFTVTAVSTGDDAIKQAKELKPDLVIADLSMEGKDGYEVCSAMKGDPDLAGIPVVLLHGSTTPVDDAKAKAAKADGQIAKPFETQALIDMVKEIAAAPPAKTKEPIGPIESLAPPMASDDIVIDTTSLEEPAKPAVAKPAEAKPTAPPKPAPPPKPVSPPKPAAAKPAAAKPAPPPAKKPTPPPKPAPKPVPPPLTKPALAKPATPAPPKPLTPALSTPEPVEITIEAEPPPAGAGVSWDGPTFEQGVPVPEPPRPDSTLIGVGQTGPVQPQTPTPIPAMTSLPTPPPGMPLPPKVQAPPVTPGQPYEPAVYEAISKLSREVIEKIVWEVVPDLAETIIREELDRLVEKRRSS
jgi:CheY-like chemotaxis protein